MTDLTQLIERVRVAREETAKCWDANGSWIGGETTPLEDIAPEMADLLFAQEERLKAADALVEALNRIVGRPSMDTASDRLDEIETAIRAYADKGE